MSEKKSFKYIVVLLLSLIIAMALVKVGSEFGASAPLKTVPTGVTVVYDFSKVGDKGLFLAAHKATKLNDFTAADNFLQELTNKKDIPVDIARYSYANLALMGNIDVAAKVASVDINNKDAAFLPFLLVMADNAKNGKYAEAIAALHKAKLEDWQKHYSVMFEAWLLMAEGKGDEAIKKLDTIKNVKGFKTPYAFHKGLILDLMGNSKAAESYYLQAMGKNGKVSIRGLQVLISFYRRTGQEQKAKDSLQIYRNNAASLDSVGEDLFYPDNMTSPINTPVKGLAEAVLGMSSNFTAKPEDKETALILLQIVLFLDKDNVPARVLLADVLENSKMFKEAIAEYQKLDVGTQLYDMGLLKQAQLYMKLKNFAKAKEILLSLAKKSDDNFAVMVALASIYAEEKDYKKAITYYDKAIGNVEAQGNVLAGMLASRAMVYQEMGKDDLAEKDYVASLNINPNDVVVLNTLGYSWLIKNKNMAQAETMIVKAAELSPNDGYVVDSLGWLLYLVGDYDRAIMVLEKALELKPANSIINDHLGDVYWKKGWKRAAKYQWERAIKFNNEIKPDEIAVIETKLKIGLDAYEEMKAKNERSHKSKGKNKP